MAITAAVLTTLPHYLAMIPWCNSHDTTYPYMVFVNTSLSALWHFYGEPKYTILFFADHLGAVVWFAFDLQLVTGLSEDKGEFIIAANIATLLLYALSVVLGKYHAAWHIFSAIKCILVSVVATQD